MCQTDQLIAEEFESIVRNILDKVDNSKWKDSIFRTDAIYQVALATIPDQFEWDIRETVDGRVSIILTGYKPNLEEIINVH